MKGSESRHNHRYAVVVQDLATQWLQSYLCKTRTSQETRKSLIKFLEPTTKPKVIYNDDSLEFGKSCEELSWTHCSSTPHRSETNGIAERAVRRVKGDLRYCCNQVWTQDGVAAICEIFRIFCLMGNHHMKSGSEYHLISPYFCYRPIERPHHFDPKVLRSKFFGYILYAGGIWKGDIMVADIEEMEEMDASELHARRLNAKELLTPQRSGNFIFPVADGTVKICGREQRLRTSTLTRDQPERGEEQEILQGISDEWKTPFHLEEDPTRDNEAKSDFWTITREFICRHHPESNFSCREKNHSQLR